MKRRLLILLLLLACLGILRTEDTVQADDCYNCLTSYQQCGNSASSAFSSCEFSALIDWEICMLSNLSSTCNPPYQQALDNCVSGYEYATLACEQTYSSCLYANCGGGGGGGGGGTQSCESPAMGNGYSAMCVAQYGSMLSSCIDNGAAAFDGWNIDTSGLETCLANAGANDCCRDFIKIVIEQRCGCNRDQRNPDCKACFSF